MFNSMYSHISMITLLVFAAVSKDFQGESTMIEEDIEKLLLNSRDELPRLAQSILISEGEIKRQKDKINNATAGTVNDSVESYISCWRKFYENVYGLELFMNMVYKIQHEPEQFGPYTEEHSLRQCVQDQANTYAAQLLSVQSIDCEQYRPSVHGEDFHVLKNEIKYSYYQGMLYGQAILFKNIHETALDRLKRLRIRKYRRM
ncbi:unnamed protein product [Trichobilharzia szidati]|nr:unnamed protein product [Trichobilharzia szidati]